MAEGEFPDADAAAARALIVLIRDVLQERAPVTALSRIEVQGKIASAVSAVRDLRSVPAGTRLMGAVVQRKGDSVTAEWTMQASGVAAPTASASIRASARVDDITRVAAAIAQAALQAASIDAESMGSAPPALGSIEAGEAYTIGLAEALSTTPAALMRARTSLTRATELAPGLADVWRWRARVEHSLVEWNRDPSTAAMARLLTSLVVTATRAAALAPRSAGAQLVLADAHLAAGGRAKAEAALRSAGRLDASSPGLIQRQAAMSRVNGDDGRALQLLRGAVQQSPNDGPLLAQLALLARVRGERSLSCAALNAAVRADEELAPAYALRALARAEYGERRPGWIDAEVATRLGHPEWGERAAAVLDVRYGDQTQAPTRLRPLGGTSARPTNYLDALLLAQAAAALSPRREIPATLTSAWSCTSLRRGALMRDLRTIGGGDVLNCTAPERPVVTPRARSGSGATTSVLKKGGAPARR
jgi:tetratricopeptide (TPR) repeat protein